MNIPNPANSGWLICLTEDESPVGIAALKQEEK